MEGPVYKRPFSTLRKNEHYYAAQQLEGAFLALSRLLLLLLLGFRSAACEKRLIIPAKTFERTVGVRLARPGDTKSAGWWGCVFPRIVGRHLCQL